MGEPKVTVRAAIEVEATLANTGPRAGSATLFLFLRDPVASVARPVLELRRFVKVDLAAGESRPVRFTLERPTSPSSTRRSSPWSSRDGSSFTSGCRRTLRPPERRLRPGLSAWTPSPRTGAAHGRARCALLARH